MSYHKSSTDYEGVYLKANCTKKAFSGKNKKKITKMIEDKKFHRVIRYLASNAFRKNKALLMQSGFEFEDMLSICMVYGLNFVNYNFVAKSEKDHYYILMRFVNQRLEHFFNTIERKFHASETVRTVYLFDLHNTRSAKKNGIAKGMNLHTISSDQLLTANEKIDQTNAEISRIVERIDGNMNIHQKAGIKLAVNSMRRATETEGVRSKIRQKNSSKAYSSLKKELNQNLDKYRERLADLATSKFTAYDVRKKARKICKKNGINYVKWAEDRIASGHDKQCYVL